MNYKLNYYAMQFGMTKTVNVSHIERCELHPMLTHITQDTTNQNTQNSEC